MVYLIPARIGSYLNVYQRPSMVEIRKLAITIMISPGNKGIDRIEVLDSKHKTVGYVKKKKGQFIWAPTGRNGLEQPITKLGEIIKGGN